jgi:hypothetical protein
MHRRCTTTNRRYHLGYAFGDSTQLRTMAYRPHPNPGHGNRRHWPEVRQARRRARLDAIRSAVEGIGAPARATEDATAMLFGLSGADASWPLHDQYGLPLERIPDVIANTVRLIIEELQSQAVNDASRPAESPTRV